MDYVEITLHRNRGWPWPDDSWGLTPMFGADGWCHACGVPRHEQTGPIILQRKGFATISGGWVPYWQYDVYCLEGVVAARTAEVFGVDLRPVEWVRSSPGEAQQVVIRATREPWFDPAELAIRVSRVHGEASNTCAVCGVTRWLPVGMDVLPWPLGTALAGEQPVVASPEWFGAGKQSFRQILWRRDLADFLVAACPKDFKVQDLD